MTKIIEARKLTVKKGEAKQIIKFENDNSYYHLNIDYSNSRKLYSASLYPCELLPEGVVIISLTKGSYLTVKDNIKRYSEKEYLELVNKVFMFEPSSEANEYINKLYSKFALNVAA
jgi:hypothetical protein